MGHLQGQALCDYKPSELLLFYNLPRVAPTEVDLKAWQDRAHWDPQYSPIHLGWALFSVHMKGATDFLIVPTRPLWAAFPSLPIRNISVLSCEEAVLGDGLAFKQFLLYPSQESHGMVQGLPKKT
jgi:hypothetical protein